MSHFVPAPDLTPNVPLSARLLAANALPAFALGAVGLFFYAYLQKFYSDVAGIATATLALIVTGTRVFDAVIDPMIGSVSDRTVSRWGRRKPFVAAAVVPLAIVFWMLLTPPEGTSSAMRFAGLSMLFFVFWSLIYVPFVALSAELTPDYGERNRVFGYREAGMVAGTIFAAVVPLVVSGAGALPTDPAAQREVFARVGWIMGGILLAAVAVFLALVPERGLRADQRPTGGAWPDFSVLRGNEAFARLLVAYVIGAFGAALPATLLLFFAEHVLESERGGLFLVTYLLVGVLFFPLWTWLARRFDKKPAWLGAMVLNSGAFAGTLLLGAGDEGAFLAICVVSGIGLGGTLAIPSSMQADVIDVDEHDHGKRREGAFVGLWSIAQKLAQALGAGLALWVLGLAGYVEGPAGIGNQPDSAKMALTLLYAGVPCLCNAASMAVAWGYRLDRAAHARVREELDRRAASAAAGN